MFDLIWGDVCGNFGSVFRGVWGNCGKVFGVCLGLFLSYVGGIWEVNIERSNKIINFPNLFYFVKGMFGYLFLRSWGYVQISILVS